MQSVMKSHLPVFITVFRHCQDAFFVDLGRSHRSFIPGRELQRVRILRFPPVVRAEKSPVLSLRNVVLSAHFPRYHAFDYHPRQTRFRVDLWLFVGPQLFFSRILEDSLPNQEIACQSVTIAMCDIR